MKIASIHRQPKVNHLVFLLSSNVRTEHGVFDLPSGIFTAETTGTYQLTFSSLVYLSPGSQKHSFDLKVSEETLAFSYSDSTSKGYQPAVLSTLLPLALVESKLQLFRHSHIHPQSYILKNNDRCYYCEPLVQLCQLEDSGGRRLRNAIRRDAACHESGQPSQVNPAG